MLKGLIDMILWTSYHHQHNKAEEGNRKANDMRIEGKLEEADAYAEAEQGKLDFKFGCVGAIFLAYVLFMLLFA